ncbi:hypothetical protein C5167_011928 [Papaver somniferum]|uniref:Uncharacterized protein n=1 Tax=Papaver somniferum TaxID=3469 RepID=A0A4Y7IZE2_PAPSO|nr:hypothetical protein C5167_011928 [Papaver somniferum]
MRYEEQQNRCSDKTQTLSRLSLTVIRRGKVTRGKVTRPQTWLQRS